MPLYEYECTACHRRVEKRQKFSDPEITECPFCQGKLERTLSAPAFQFAGGGWYKDLYSSNKKDGGSDKNTEAKPAPAAASDSNTSSATNAESKPAAPAAAPAPAPATPAAATK